MRAGKADGAALPSVWNDRPVAWQLAKETAPFVSDLLAEVCGTYQRSACVLKAYSRRIREIGDGTDAQAALHAARHVHFRVWADPDTQGGGRHQVHRSHDVMRGPTRSRMDAWMRRCGYWAGH